MYGQKMSGKIHENSLPGSLKLRFSSPMVEKVEEEPVPVVPIWVWQVLFYVLCSYSIWLLFGRSYSTFYAPILRFMLDQEYN